MVVVGFDVGKDSLFAARIDRSSKVKQHYEIANNDKAITTLLGQLQKKHKQLLVAGEATGEYHRTLALACLSLDIPFKLLNPITTKQYVRATVRKRKTDKTDAVSQGLPCKAKATWLRKRHLLTLSRSCEPALNSCNLSRLSDSCSNVSNLSCRKRKS